MVPDRGQHSIGYYWQIYLKLTLEGAVERMTAADFEGKTDEQITESLIKPVFEDPSGAFPIFDWDHAYMVVPVKGNPAILIDDYLADGSDWYTGDAQISYDVGNRSPSSQSVRCLYVPFVPGQPPSPEAMIRGEEDQGVRSYQTEIENARADILGLV